MTEFLAHLQLFERDERLHDQVAKWLTAMLTDRARWSNLLSRGDRYLASLGGLGLADAVQAIDDLIGTGGNPTRPQED
jgi:hypothetical protein